MKKLFTRFGMTRRCVVAGSLALLVAAPGWAVSNSCPTASGSALSGLQTNSTFGLSCYQTDKTFSNFSVSNNSMDGGVTQSTSTVDLLTSTTLSGSESLNTPFTVSAEFEGATVADFEATSRNGGDTVTTGTLNYLVDSAPTTVNTNYPTLSPYGANYITEIKLNMSGTAGNGKANDDGITLTQTFCIGTSACTTADEIVITESIGNDSSTVTYTCSAGTGSGATCGAATGSNASYATFKVNVIEVNVTDVYALSADQNFGGNNTTTTLNNFTDVFTEDELTPEPSSILLLGGGLLGLAALRFRKRKQQA